MNRVRGETLDSVAAPRTPAGDDLARVAPSPIRTRLLKTLVGFGVLLVITCLIAPLVGSSPIRVARVFDRSIPFSENVDAQIFFIAEEVGEDRQVRGFLALRAFMDATLACEQGRRDLARGALDFVRAVAPHDSVGETLRAACLPGSP
jgi:hypothetical protein